MSFSFLGDSTEMANYRSVTKLSTSMVNVCEASTSKRLAICCAALPVKRTLSLLGTIGHRQVLPTRRQWRRLNRQLSDHFRHLRRCLRRPFRRPTIGPTSVPIFLRSIYRPALGCVAITALTRNCLPWGNVSIIRRCPSREVRITTSPITSGFRIPSILAFCHLRRKWDRRNNCQSVVEKAMLPFRRWECRLRPYPAEEEIERMAVRSCVVPAPCRQPFVKWRFRKVHARRASDSVSLAVVIRPKDQWASSSKRNYFISQKIIHQPWDLILWFSIIIFLFQKQLGSSLVAKLPKKLNCLKVCKNPT